MTLTESQRMAREAFDLDEAMAALPAYRPSDTPSASHKGQAGVRLQAHLVADISDDLLREFAHEELGAKRCSEQYLDVLRIILGNQAEAEKYGYVLEMNQRVSFAPQRVMRTILDQMQAAGISFGAVVGLGDGHSQVVQCFAGKRQHHESPAAELEHIYRKAEAQDEARREAAGPQVEALDVFLSIDPADVPF